MKTNNNAFWIIIAVIIVALAMFAYERGRGEYVWDIVSGNAYRLNIMHPRGSGGNPDFEFRTLTFADNTSVSITSWSSVHYIYKDNVSECDDYWSSTNENTLFYANIYTVGAKTSGTAYQTILSMSQTGGCADVSAFKSAGYVTDHLDAQGCEIVKKDTSQTVETTHYSCQCDGSCVPNNYDTICINWYGAGWKFGGCAIRTYNGGTGLEVNCVLPQTDFQGGYQSGVGYPQYGTSGTSTIFGNYAISAMPSATSLPKCTSSTDYACSYTRADGTVRNTYRTYYYGTCTAGYGWGAQVSITCAPGYAWAISLTNITGNYTVTPTTFRSSNYCIKSGITVSGDVNKTLQSDILTVTITISNSGDYPLTYIRIGSGSTPVMYSAFSGQSLASLPVGASGSLIGQVNARALLAQNMPIVFQAQMLADYSGGQVSGFSSPIMLTFT